ncbi:MAG: pentapeptide repeat-containing protein [Chloroflexales bacterium]|nr:pentapeptide repeat-containing protein [Chloroflexales bacterium]
MSKCDNHSLHGQHIDVSYAGEDLSGRVLSGTYVGVDFQNANLQDANLIGTFINSSFHGANLNGADTSAGTFVNSDLSTSNGASK